MEVFGRKGVRRGGNCDGDFQATMQWMLEEKNRGDMQKLDRDTRIIGGFVQRVRTCVEETCDTDDKQGDSR